MKKIDAVNSSGSNAERSACRLTIVAQNDVARKAEVAIAIGTSNARRTQKCITTISSRPANAETIRSVI